MLFAGSGMACEVAGEVPEALDSDVGAVAYRVTQEAARNALRHSGATQVRVTLEHAGEELVVSVADDGVGLAGYGPDFPDHAGLWIIDQRAGRLEAAWPLTPGCTGEAPRWW